MSNFSQIQADLFNSKQAVFIDRFFKNLETQTLGKNTKEAFTLLLKCEQLGFSFDNQLLNVVSHATVDEMENFWDWMVKTNQKIYGASNYKPMYPNFPKQVIEADELELLFNAFLHYTGDLFGIRIVPQYKEKNRKALREEVNPLRMKVMTEGDLNDYLVNVMTSNTSLSASVKDLMKNVFNYLAEKDKGAVEYLLSKNPIPQKENLAFMGAVVLKSDLDFESSLSAQFKTPTDLLRLVAALNDGDTSLVKDTKVKNLSRPMRKALASKLNSILENGDFTQFVENMFTYREQWTRLAHGIHIGEYQSKFPLAYKALQKIRANDKDESFNYQIEKLLKDNHCVKASEMLKQRPGVFGRMLNQVLLKASSEEDQNVVLNNFKTASHSISTPVLLQIHAKFKYDNQNSKKIILPKGGLGKVYVRNLSVDPASLKLKKVKPQKVANAPLTNSLQAAFKKTLKLEKSDVQTPQAVQKEYVAPSVLSSDVANKVVVLIEETLIERFKAAPSLGNVYIEDSLVLQNVPFAQRAASKALKTVPKGSRFIKESDKPIIRFFTWWNEKGVDKNGNPLNVGRVDIDLSVGVFDAGYNLIKTCAYYDLRSSDYLAHSGDITSAPNGAAEYIDVHIEKLLADVPGAAYVGQLISSYTQQKYIDLPECYAGWMEREQKQHGEIFEASTVQNKVDITCDSTQVLVCLYDIARKEYIWADSPMKGGYVRNNLDSVKSVMSYTIEGLAEMKKPNLYDLFEMHAKARGVIVQDKSQAQTVFSIKEGITPFDSEVIASQFMADDYVPKELVKKPKMK